MKKLLLIDSDVARAQRLIEQAQAGAAGIHLAPDGFYALTMLERDRPELIVTRPRLKDMSADELCMIIRRDASQQDARVILLAEPDEAAQLTAPFDLILREQDLQLALSEPSRLTWERLRALAHGDPETDNCDTVVLVTPQPPTDNSATAGALSGSLLIFNLAELVETLALTKKSGKLTLQSESGPGFIIFNQGQVVHALFNKLVGRTAFAALFYETKKNKDAAFRFEPMAAEQTSVFPQTIEIPSQQLLQVISKDLKKNNTLELRIPAGFFDELKKK